MYSPAVLEAFDAIYNSSVVMEEPEIIFDSETLQTALCGTCTNETSDILCEESDADRHWYLHTRQWVHRQSTDSSISTGGITETLKSKALSSSAVKQLVEDAFDKPSAMEVAVQVVEVDAMEP